MTTGVWDPNASSSSQEHTNNYQLDADFLKRIINTVNIDEPQSINNLLSEDELKEHRDIMLLPKETWFSTLENFNNEELIALIRFFTLAEVQFTNWQAEERSPVIWIAKLLRKRKHAIHKDLLIWIKNNNKNKFLPFGAL